MNAAQFQTWVKQGPTAADVTALRDLVARYPYSGVLQVVVGEGLPHGGGFEPQRRLACGWGPRAEPQGVVQALMGPALVEAAQHIHQEVLAAPDVSEEELVKLVWHDADVASEPA